MSQFFFYYLYSIVYFSVSDFSQCEDPAQSLDGQIRADSRVSPHTERCNILDGAITLKLPHGERCGNGK